MKRQYLYFPRRNHHSRRQRLVDYYGTRLMINKFSKFLEETIRPRDDRQFDYHSTRRNNSRQPTTSFVKRQPADWPSTQKESTIHLNIKKYCSGHKSTQKPKEYYNNCSSLWRRLQATDNPISDGFHLRDILREFLL